MQGRHAVSCSCSHLFSSLMNRLLHLLLKMLEDKNQCHNSEVSLMSDILFLFDFHLINYNNSITDPRVLNFNKHLECLWLKSFWALNSSMSLVVREHKYENLNTTMIQMMFVVNWLLEHSVQFGSEMDPLVRSDYCKLTNTCWKRGCQLILRSRVFRTVQCLDLQLTFGLWLEEQGEGRQACFQISSCLQVTRRFGGVSMVITDNVPELPPLRPADNYRTRVDLQVTPLLLFFVLLSHLPPLYSSPLGPCFLCKNQLHTEKQ